MVSPSSACEPTALIGANWCLDAHRLALGGLAAEVKLADHVRPKIACMNKTKPKVYYVYSVY